MQNTQHAPPPAARRIVPRPRWPGISLAIAVGLSVPVLILACEHYKSPTGPEPLDPALVAQGKTVFRFDTYGDETFWTDTLRLHEVIRTSVSPRMALSVGLKVDADTLPAQVKADLQAGRINLDDPATTVTLLKLGAVVGVIGQVDANNTLTRVGITCAGSVSASTLRPTESAVRGLTPVRITSCIRSVSVQKVSSP